MRIDVVTLFPNMFEGVLSESILKIAREKGVVDVRLHNLRDYSTDRHKKVDAPPYGGGPGMVIMAEPVCRAVEDLRAKGAGESELILLTPAGRRYDQALARELSAKPGLILLCGRYEGFDERIVEELAPREISIGDYVMTGGEIAAMAVLDSVVRLLPGALGCAGSTEDESFSAGTIEYPQYTRPAEWRGRRVPEVLLSGHHEKIEAWRREIGRRRTLERRPDLKP